MFMVKLINGESIGPYSRDIALECLYYERDTDCVWSCETGEVIAIKEEAIR